MKKAVLVLGLLSIFATAASGYAVADAACAQSYGNILDGYAALINAPGSDEVSDEVSDGAAGVLEAVARIRRQGGDALDSVGYAIKDISGDNIPELLVGAVAGKKGSSAHGSEVYAVYTCANGVPSFAFNGTARSSYRWMGNGKFYYLGSGGAMYAIFGTYVISPDGRSLSSKDYYFTFEKDKNFEHIGFFHNTSGKWDKSASEELMIEEKDFRQIQKGLEVQVRQMKLIPFSAYAHSKPNVGRAAAGLPVRAQWAKNALSGVAAYGEFVADRTEPQVGILLSAERIVRNFKVLKLDIKDVDDNGKITFAEKELYALDSLAPEKPLVIRMTFYGTIPHYGISYVDGGKTKKFTLEESGMDGSLLMREF